MRRIMLLAISIIAFLSVATAQSQKVAVKTNFLHWTIAGTPNLGAEVALSPKYTLDVIGGYNWFEFSDNRKAKHWIVSPEVRYWLGSSFVGHFFGLHLFAAEFNIGGWDIPVGRLANFKDGRYEGNVYGAGLSYGHQFVLSPKFNLELSLGAGYAYVPFKKYGCGKCTKLIKEGNYNYFGVTRATLSLVYKL